MVGTSDPDLAVAEPDPRVLLANERTLLAWNRTALALLAGGLAIGQFLPIGSAAARLIGLPLVLWSAVMAIGSARRWRDADAALRAGAPLPRSALPAMLTLSVAAGAVVVAVILAIAR